MAADAHTLRTYEPGPRAGDTAMLPDDLSDADALDFVGAHARELERLDELLAQLLRAQQQLSAMTASASASAQS